MSELNIALVATGGLVLGLGLLSAALKRRTFLTEPLVALTLGVLLGPAALDLLDLARWGDPATILKEAARLTLAIGVMAIALRLPASYFRSEWRSMLAVLGLLMPAMWIATSLVAYLLLGVPPAAALLLGGVLTPTDPIVATSIVTGPTAERFLPERLRHLLSAESGANDGLAHPFVWLGILLLMRPAGDALGQWLGWTVLWQVGGAAAAGIGLGYGAGRLLHAAESQQLIEKTSFLAYTVALSLIVVGTADLLGVDGILSVFIAGLAFDQVVGGGERAEEAGVQEAVSQFFTLPVFMLLGIALPWEAWRTLGWSAPGLAAGVLLVRRVPAMLALRRLVPGLRRRRDAAYAGWFGPIGVAALFYALVALDETGLEEPWIAGSLVICASIVAHGVTATPFTWWYGKDRARG